MEQIKKWYLILKIRQWIPKFSFPHLISVYWDTHPLIEEEQLVGELQSSMRVFFNGLLIQKWKKQENVYPFH